MTTTEADPTTGELVAYHPTHPSPLTPSEAKERAQWVREVTKAALTEGTDFGTIPGTDRPSLYKAGAEMLLLAAGLGFRMQRIDDDAARTHEGVTYRCSVYRGDVVVAECDGYAGYDESRFFTSAEEATRRERENAAKYQRKVRESKCVEYRAPWNSVVKMAQKRALVGAALNAVAGSGLFTQDLEDAADTPAAFDPMALLRPHLAQLDETAKAALSTWRTGHDYPAPSHMTPEQTAEALVEIGRILAIPRETAPAAEEPPKRLGRAEQQKIIRAAVKLPATVLSVLIFGVSDSAGDTPADVPADRAEMLLGFISDAEGGKYPSNYDEVAERWEAWKAAQDQEVTR